MANGGNKPNRPLRPRGGSGPGSRRRRVVIDNQAARPRQDPRQARGGQPDGGRRETARQAPAQPTGPVAVESGVTVRDFSQALGVTMPNIIKILMGLGQMKTATQSLTDEEVELIAAELEREVTIKHADEEDEEPEAYDDPEEALEARPPVVTIMGHVDHGKTTLLDAIRQTHVVATEAGGITQHIGAYQVDVNGRKITFLDTPGHEAFTAMRARGAKVTDIAVLVVAADDGVMPQTKESISHARAADVPIVVAINKIDLPDSNIDRVKAELAQEALQPEEWGGTTQFAEVSAKAQQNLAALLERILLVADLELDLRANPNVEASGPIIESRLDVGRGPVATMLVHRGTLKVGDAIVAGDAHGRVKALFNYKGEKQASAGPGDPVEILGFDKPPPAGEVARVVDSDRTARELAQRRAERLRREQLATQRPTGVSLENLFEQMQSGVIADLNLVIKGDVVGSVEAVVSELSKFEHSEVRLNVIHQGVGAITQNDIMLASASDALILGFNVRPNAEARELAVREGVEIRTYNVIYKLTEDIEQALVGKLTAVKTEETIGEAEVRALFKVSRLGTIAGCMVTSGVVRRNAQVRVVRDGTVIYTTTIAALKRFKDDAREVQEGFECGILLDGFNDVKEGDVLEVFETREIERTSLDEVASPAASPLRTPVASGFVGVLTCELHFPEAHSLKEKRHYVRSAKAQLQHRVGASVAEVDHHDVWQRARLTVACVAREHRELERLLDEAERWLLGQAWEVSLVERLDRRSGRLNGCNQVAPWRNLVADVDVHTVPCTTAACRNEDHADGSQERRGRESRPVRREPISAPGIDPAAPTAKSVQSIPPGRWPTRPAAPTRDPDDEVRADRAAGLLADPAEERRQPQRAEDEPDQPAEDADHGSGEHRRPDVRLGAWRGRGRGSGAPRPQEVDAEQEQRRADHDPEHVCGHVRGGRAAADRAEDGGRQHPGDEPPVDATRPDVRDRGGGRREPGDRDVGAARRRRARRREEQHGQPDVAQHEPHQAARQGDEEAPDADSDQRQHVHRLEYVP